ncbi:MAG: SPOR domain-containing protein [Bacteroidia bacterium]|nr:SPOR domain-containing protein [Bacteroidia bacterium]
MQGKEKYFFDALHKALLTKEYCSLEGLGMLYLVRVPARIQKDIKTLFPPVYEARINASISSPDPLLPIVLKEISLLTEEECNSIINQQTENIRLWLDWKKSAHLPGIGTLYSDEKNNLYLKSEFFHPDDLGKKPLFLKEIKKESGASVAPPMPEALTNEKMIAPSATSSNENVPHKKKKVLKQITRAAAVVLFFLLLALLLNYINLKELRRQQIYFASVLSSAPSSGAYQPFAGEFRENEIKYFSYPSPTFLFDEKGLAKWKINETEITIMKNPSDFPREHHRGNALPTYSKPPELPPAEQRGRFFIVAGSFSVTENAKKFLEKLKKKGYTAVLAGISPKGLHMVAAASAPTMADAENELNKIREEFPTAWIFKP